MLLEVEGAIAFGTMPLVQFFWGFYDLRARISSKSHRSRLNRC